MNPRLLYATVVLTGLLASPAWAVPRQAELEEVRTLGKRMLTELPEERPEQTNTLTVLQGRNSVLKNETVWKTPLNLGGKTLKRGLYVDAPAVVRVRLDQPAQRFTATVGIDHNEDTLVHPEKGSARFHVSARRKRLVSTPVLKLADGGHDLDVPLDGAREFLLEVDDGGDGIGWDQCDWGNAAVVTKDGATVYLDDLPLVAAEEQQWAFPVSFLYGGQPSEWLVGRWQRAVQETPFDGGTTRTLTLTDPASGLVLTCSLKCYEKFPAIDWVCHLENTGPEDTPLIEDLLPLDSTLFPESEAPATLRWSTGDHNIPDAFFPHDEALKPGMIRRFAPDGGRSSNGTFPFFNVMKPDGGWILALGWTGQWSADFTLKKTGQVVLRAGMERTRFRLRPGERVRTPRIVLLRWQGDAPSRGHNLFRQLVLAHYSQRTEGELDLPPIAHNTAATIYQTGKPTNEANQFAMLDRAAELGCEGYWLDAYWYPQPWWKHVGDWFPRARDFPRGLAPIGERAHEKGVEFILWFEPERVREGTLWDKDHPNFLLSRSGIPDRLYNLGNPEACSFLIDFIDARIKEWGLDVYRQDFNFNPLPYWQANDAEDRQGISEMKYVEGLYRFWDTLIEGNPGLTIDNCASGGRRIDLEACSRSYPLWRSDRNDIGEGLKGQDYYPYMGLADQLHNAGLNLYVPLQTGPVWDATPYNWRSAMSTGIVIYGDIDKFPTDDTRRGIAEIKDLRPLLLGDFYILTSLTRSNRDWHVVQFHRSDLAQGCVLFFRRPASPYSACEIELNGIDPDGSYEISLTGETYERGARKQVLGSELVNRAISIKEKPGSAILRYRCLAP